VPLAEPLRKILNPVSLLELSVHAKPMLELDAAEAVNPEGADGIETPDCVVALAVLVYPELPDAL